MNEDRRCWRYREGESRLFNSPDDVPDGEGWVDSPALVGVSAPKRRGRPPKVAAPANDEAEANTFDQQLDSLYDFVGLDLAELKTDDDGHGT